MPHGTMSGVLVDGAESQQALLVVKRFFFFHWCLRSKFRIGHHNNDEETVDFAFDRPQELAEKCTDIDASVVYNACNGRTDSALRCTLLGHLSIGPRRLSIESKQSFSEWTCPCRNARCRFARRSLVRASLVQENV